MLKSEIVRISDGRQFPLCADADVYVPPLFFSGTIFIFADARVNSSCYIARSDWVLRPAASGGGVPSAGSGLSPLKLKLAPSSPLLVPALRKTLRRPSRA